MSESIRGSGQGMRETEAPVRDEVVSWSSQGQRELVGPARV